MGILVCLIVACWVGGLVDVFLFVFFEVGGGWRIFAGFVVFAWFLYFLVLLFFWGVFI